MLGGGRFDTLTAVGCWPGIGTMACKVLRPGQHGLELIGRTESESEMAPMPPLCEEALQAPQSGRSWCAVGLLNVKSSKVCGTSGTFGGGGVLRFVGFFVGFLRGAVGRGVRFVVGRFQLGRFCWGRFLVGCRVGRFLVGFRSVGRRGVGLRFVGFLVGWRLACDGECAGRFAAAASRACQASNHFAAATPAADTGSCVGVRLACRRIGFAAARRRRSCCWSADSPWPIDAGLLVSTPPSAPLLRRLRLWLPAATPTAAAWAVPAACAPSP